MPFLGCHEQRGGSITVGFVLVSIGLQQKTCNLQLPVQGCNNAVAPSRASLSLSALASSQRRAISKSPFWATKEWHHYAWPCPCNKSRATSNWRTLAATNTGLAPSRSALFLSALDSSKRRATSKCPFRAAINNGVAPSRVSLSFGLQQKASNL